jgi:hypothetical protein
MEKSHKKQKGRPTIITKACKCCNKEFKTTKQKCTHESKMRSKKSKTEIGDRDTNTEDIFGTQSMEPKKNIFTLGDTGAFSKFKQL